MNFYFNNIHKNESIKNEDTKLHQQKKKNLTNEIYIII